MLFKQVVVWCKGRHHCHSASCEPSNIAALQGKQHEEGENVVGRAELNPFIVNDNRNHCVETNEGSLLKVEDVRAICGASFRENYNWWVISRLLNSSLPLT
jgi:hypothetical protein